jgi:hypothetical protein
LKKSQFGIEDYSNFSKNIPAVPPDDISPLIFKDDKFGSEIEANPFPEEGKESNSSDSESGTPSSNSNSLSAGGSMPSQIMVDERRDPFTFQSGSVYDGE